jgi:5'-deoxynucleotidase YfbR-like HD superfamily hydrolase
MGSPIIDEFDLRLARVERWAIIHTIQTQSVAEHCYNVALIADRLAVHCLGITDPGTLYNINRWALRHDKLEATTGDVPTIVKDCLDESTLTDRYSDFVTDGGNYEQRVRNIVKIADRLDAILFLALEESMGNKTVRDIRESIEADLWRRIDMWYSDETRDTLVKTIGEVLRSLFGPASDEPEMMQQHYDRRGHGSSSTTSSFVSIGVGVSD